MSILSKLTDLGREIAKATQSVQENIAELRAQIAAKRMELAHAQDAPLPREEIKVRIRSWVTEAGELWRRQRADRLLYDFGRPAGPSPSWSWIENMTWGAACFLCPEQVTAALTGQIEATEYVAGPPARERPAAVARLSKELADLEAAEESAIDEAAQAGVQIAHRPEVVKRRLEEAGRKDRQEKWTAGARERQSAIDQRPATRRSVSSPYLDAMTRDRAGGN
jgi:hypothetical protein